MTTAATAQSWLFVPGDRPERFARAAGAGSDAVICDLEDAVAPAAKADARAAVVRWLDAGGSAYVRVNPPGAPGYAEDIAALRGCAGLLGVVVPKAEDAGSLMALGRELPGRPIVAMVESAAGLACAFELASVDSVARLAFGELDFASDIAATPTRELMLPVRLALVLASRRAERAAPIDGVTVTLEDEAATFADARHARAVGFGGKLCIHPRQVTAVNRALSPSTEEIAWARDVIAAGGGVDGGGVSRTATGQLVDRPVLLRAQAILDGVAESELACPSR